MGTTPEVDSVILRLEKLKPSGSMMTFSARATLS